MLKKKGVSAVSRKKWILNPIDKNLAAQIAEAHSLDPFTALILLARGISEYEDVEEFLDNDFSFCDPFLIKDMDKAADRINSALENKEKIAVFGDYDADGVTSTAILMKYLSSRGADVVYHIPDRIAEGYGMNKEAIEEISKENVSLIITVDNGISAVQEVEYAKTLGIDTVVTDHHQVGEKLPDAVAVVDPHREDCNIHFREWAGVGVAFKLICALEKGDYSYALNEYADIIAVGTIADVVDLKDENRAIVKYGIAKINSSPCDGISALKQMAGVGERPLSSLGVTYSLAPRINAAGRIASATLAVKLLLSDSLSSAFKTAEEIDSCNISRHDAESVILNEAVNFIESNDTLKYSRIIVVCGDGWHRGVIGIVAAKIAEKYGRPAIVITFEGDEGTGSARSIKEFSIYDAIKSCDDILTHFGGHKLAAGMGIKRDRINEFFERINVYAATQPAAIPTLNIDCKLNPAYITADLVHSLEILEPFGAGNQQPVFGIFGAIIQEIREVGVGKHLRLSLLKSGTTVTAMKFSTTLADFPFREGDTVDLAVKIEKNEFRGRITASVHIKDMRYSGINEDRLFGSVGLYEKYRRGETLTEQERQFLIPSRDFLLAAYNFLKQYRSWKFGIESMLYRVKCPAENYCRMNVALDVLTELGLIKNEKGVYIFDGDGKKTDLSQSAILNKLQNTGGEG